MHVLSLRAARVRERLEVKREEGGERDRRHEGGKKKKKNREKRQERDERDEGDESRVRALCEPLVGASAVSQHLWWQIHGSSPVNKRGFFAAAAAWAWA